MGSQQRRRWSSTATMAAGSALLLLAAVLLLRPAVSAPGLAPWAAAAFLLAGSSQLLLVRGVRSWRSLSGGVWLGIGLALLLWPTPSTSVLTGLVGTGLLLVGIIDLLIVLRSHRASAVRFAGAAGGITHGGLGLGVLLWPSMSAFTLGVVLGAWLLLLGMQVLVTARDRQRVRADPGTAPIRRRSVAARLAGGISMLLVAALAVAAAIIIERDTTPEPGEFYAGPGELDQAPGSLLRIEVIDDYVDGGTAYRVLYTSRDLLGAPVAKSGVVVLPEGGPVPDGGRPVLAHTHGTIGIDRSCAPSLLDAKHAEQVWGLESFLADGWIVAAPDYLGLGGEGDHPYLIGRVAAHGTLDIVRAAIELAAGDGSPRFAVAGHSQGGHAALFTGQRAARDAPELELIAVAALAPASDLAAFIETNDGTVLGNLLGAYAVSAWDRAFDDIDAASIVHPAVLPILDRVATTCLAPGPELMALLLQAELLKLGFLLSPIWDTEPWASRIADNTPGGQRFRAPLLLVQGTRDSLIRADIQRGFNDRLCANGQVVEYREIDGAGHLDVSHQAGDTVVSWLTERHAGVPAPGTCPTLPPPADTRHVATDPVPAPL